MKKLLVVILSFIMIFAVVPCALISADTATIYVDVNSATDSNANTYQTLQEAVTAATAGTSTAALGSTIVFKSDYTITSAVTVNKKYVTLDLNGYTINVTGSAGQGLSIAVTGVTVKNGNMTLTTTGNYAFYDIYNGGAYTLNIEDIDFTVNNKITYNISQPGAAIRNTAGAITNVRCCNFVYGGVALTGNDKMGSLVSCSTGTLNIYNSTIDGNNNLSAFAIRGNNTTQQGKLSIYNTKISNCYYLLSGTTSNASIINSLTTFYKASVNNVENLLYEPEKALIFTAEHSYFSTTEDVGTEVTLDSLSTPYTFYANCNHSMVEGECEYCHFTSDEPGTIKYSVSIDANSTEVAEGENFTFPTCSDNVVCYTDGTNFYNQNDTLQINSNIEFTSVTLNLIMAYGAQMRLNEITGIRFLTLIDQDNIDSLESIGATIIDAGTLIAPKDLIGTDDLTTSSIVDSKCVNVPFSSINDWYKNNGTQSCIAGSLLVNLDNHINMEFVGRGYMTVSIGGITKTIYAKYNEALTSNNTRSIGWIASQLKQNDEYNTLDSSKQAIVDNIAEQYVATRDVAVEYFKYKTPNYNNSGTATDTGAIMLPKNYTENGTPVRLVIDCHGYGYTVNSSTNTFYEGRFPFIDTLVHDGYAVIEAVESVSHMGSPYAVNSYINAYKYAIENYNVYDEVYVNGNSMGGITSLNLVCSGEIPVIAHSMQYPILSTYRQSYYNAWDKDNRMRVSYWYTFDFPTDENGTTYTHQTYPFTQTVNAYGNADELKLYQDNFFNHIATKDSIFRYTNILNQDQTGFASGFEDFLTSVDDTRVSEIYDSITINYPVPVYVQHSVDDAAANVKWTKKFVAAVNAGTTNTAGVQYFEGSKHGGDIGAQVSYTAKDGTELSVRQSSVNMSAYITGIENSITDKK